MTATAVSKTGECNRGPLSGGDAQHEQSDSGQVVSFRLANEEYGLNIMDVQEIILPGEITAIPEVPAYMCGIINLRGRVIPIVDLRKRFELDAAEQSEHTRIVVVNTQRGTTFGVVVDAVTEVVRVESSQVEPPPTGLAGIDGSYIRGLLKREERIMILLDVECVLSSDDESILAANATA